VSDNQFVLAILKPDNRFNHNGEPIMHPTPLWQDALIHLLGSFAWLQ